MKKRPYFLYFSYSLILMGFLLTGIITGCDNTLDPIDREKGIYSIYGVLDMTKQANYIRVKDLNTPFVSESTKTIDATVTLQNLGNGNTEVLEDRRVQFDGIYTHNFKTTMNLDPETRYRLTAERSDGRSVSATATTPKIVTSSASPQNETCFTNITLTFSPVQEKFLEVELGVEYQNRKFWLPANRLDLFNTGEDTPDDEVTLTFDPYSLLWERFNPTGERDTVCCYELSSDQIFVRYTTYGPDYFKDTIEDSVDLPGEEGAFGALNRDSYSFPIDTTNVCDPPN